MRALVDQVSRSLADWFYTAISMNPAPLTLK